MRKQKATIRKPTRKSNARKKKSSQNALLRFLKRVPSWILWTSGVVLVCLYAFILYYWLIGPFSMRWRAQYGEVPEPEGYEVRGIDISHYQRNIDWAKLQEASINDAPLRFVVIKATEGVSIKDNTFASNIDKARRMHIITGAYHYFIPACSARRQAEYYIRNVTLQRGDLPPILDVEEKGRLSNGELQAAVLEWLSIVEEHYGVTPILYTGYDFKKTYLSTSALNRYPLWLARYYTKELDYQGDWKLWQYTDKGHIDGIRGDVDCNVFNGTLHELRQLCIK